MEAERLREPVVLLPLGAVEAHGPHLPLDADTVMAQELARRCAAALERTGKPALVAPPITSTAASFAASFPGTIDVPAEVEQRAIVEVARSFANLDRPRVVLVNLHFDPEHLRAVRGAVQELGSAVAFPDLTRRANAQRIGGEFATGDCHAGQFETSLMLAAAPQRVLPAYRHLPAVKAGLVAGIQAGKRSFRDLGMDQAYCGDPAAATREEGERLYEVLTSIVLGGLDAA
jgi:creatinine amidohydrolase